ncbi:MAG: hypothetical protein ABW033_04740 [Acidimicrobiia bacterium]
MLVALASVVILVPVLELWNADLSVPLASVYEPMNDYVYSRDAAFYLMMAKGGIDHLWYLSNPTLGWPLGQQVYDLPQSLDNLNYAVLKVLGVVFGDVGTTVNVFFVLTFAAVAVAAFLVLRRLRVSAPTSFVVALLYAFLPYHFARGVPHLLLSAYWVVPIAVYLVLRTVSERPPFTEARDSPRGFRIRLFDRSGILWLLACVAIASTGSYYGVFTVVLLAIVAFVDVLANRRMRVAASAAVALAAIAVVAFVNLLPSFIYWAQEGSNDALFRRLPYETEAEGLKVSQLLLPIEHHRFEPFAETQADSTRFTPVPSEEGQHLGIIGALGFLGVLAALLVAGRRRGADAPGATADGDEAATARAARAPPDEEQLDDEQLDDEQLDDEPADGVADDGLTTTVVLRTLGILVVGAILVATISGVSLLISGAGFRDIRSWNRIVVFIAFASFVAVGFGLDWIGRRLPARAWRTPVIAIGLALVLLFGILDQVSPASIPDYAVAQAGWNSDDAFVHKIERVLHDGQRLASSDSDTPAVFQLPYRYFPEAPQEGNLGPYDLVRGYLHSSDLNWGWGGVRGRGADWQQNVIAHPVDDFLDRIAAVGYSGLMLDRLAFYEDGAPSEDALTEVLGEPMVSDNGQLVFWDLRDYATDLRDRIGADGVKRLRAETLADVPKVRAQGS